MSMPRYWQVGAWMHENVLLAHYGTPRWWRPRWPEAVKKWMCASFDWLIYEGEDE